MPRILMFLVVAAGISASSCSRTDVTAAVVDARAVLPDSALRKETNVRHYMLVSVKSLDRDLPFTSLSATGDLPAPKRVWVGVFARTPGTWTNAPAGVYTVGHRSEFPEYVHGGCQAINIVADARSGETLSSWCNPDDSQGHPVTTPWYNAKGSPFF